MTRDETKELLMMIRAIYPNFNVKPAEMTPTVNAWHMMLEEYPATAAVAALKVYTRTNDSGFAPSVSQLIAAMYKPAENKQLTEGDAWNLVKRALQDSTYHAVDRFLELPETVQKAVGSANMLQQWAMSDSNEVNTVIMSNFQRTYRAVVERESFSNKIPPQLMKELAEKTGFIGIERKHEGG
jgi:hypothetical protein